MTMTVGELSDELSGVTLRWTSIPPHARGSSNIPGRFTLWKLALALAGWDTKLVYRFLFYDHLKF